VAGSSRRPAARTHRLPEAALASGPAAGQGGRPGAVIARRLAAGMTLCLSAGGYPATQYALRRWGTAGAAVAGAVCAGLALRDAAMIRGGAPDRLRPIPAALLRAEFAVAVAASVPGLHPLVAARAAGPAVPQAARRAENARRGAVAMLFALHTIRFAIYLTPGRGRRPAQT
jgi:hypothetical protein